MNSFIKLTGNFVPESGCKGRTFLNITQAFLRKMFKRNVRFHISLHKTNTTGEYTLYIGTILGHLPHPLINYETHATNAKPPKPYPIEDARPQKRPLPHRLSPVTDDTTHTKSSCSAPQQLSP